MADNHANTQLAILALRERMRAGEIDSLAANVEMIRIERFRLVSGRIPRAIRAALNAAVASKTLGRLPKSGAKPEAYFHPTFEYLAKAARNQAEARTHAALSAVCCAGQVPA